MQVLVDHLTRSATPRPKPRAKSRQSLNQDRADHIQNNHHQNHDADGRKSSTSVSKGAQVVKIQKDPFSPPVYRYKSERTWKTMWGTVDTAPEYIKRSENQVVPTTVEKRVDQREVSNITTSVGNVVLQNPDPDKSRRLLDPRRTSRSSSARKDMYSRLRYENPVTASPSRDMDRPKPWEEYFEEPVSFVGSRGKTSYVNPPSNG